MKKATINRNEHWATIRWKNESAYMGKRICVYLVRWLKFIVSTLHSNITFIHLIRVDVCRYCSTMHILLSYLHSIHNIFIVFRFQCVILFWLLCIIHLADRWLTLCKCNHFALFFFSFFSPCSAFKRRSNSREPTTANFTTTAARLKRKKRVIIIKRLRKIVNSQCNEFQLLWATQRLYSLKQTSAKDWVDVQLERGIIAGDYWTVALQ